MGPSAVFVPLLVLWALVQAFATAHWVFAPLYHSRSVRPLKTQFTLVDMLVLAAEAQAVLALVVTTTPAVAVGERILLAIGALSIFGGMWWGGVLTLSRCGPLDPWKRAVFLALAVPLGYGGSFALAFAAPLCVLSLLAGSQAQSTLLWGLAIAGLLGAGVVLSRQIVVRFAARPSSAIGTPEGAK